MTAKKKTVHEKVIREVIEKPAKKKSRAKKRTTKRKSSSSKSAADKKIYDALVENFISLQKVMVNLSVKFDGLNTQISKLLELFEISAKALAEKDFSTGEDKRENHEVVDKMNEILEQNKVIARGLTLMHDRISEEGGIPYSLPPTPSQRMPLPTPTMPMPKPKMMMQQNPVKMPSPVKKIDNSPAMKKSEIPEDTYERSISSLNSDFNDNVEYTS